MAAKFLLSRIDRANLLSVSPTSGQPLYRLNITPDDYVYMRYLLRLVCYGSMEWKEEAKNVGGEVLGVGVLDESVDRGGYIRRAGYGEFESQK